MRASWIFACLAILTVLGCGQSSNEPAAEDATAEASSATAPQSPAARTQLPAITVSKSKVDDTEPRFDLTPEYREGSAEWTLEQITKLRASPIPTDPQEVTRIRRDRNRRIIDLATKVIAETHKSPNREELFNAAVHQLLEARLEMALRGHPDDIDALYEDVKNLDERDHDSVAAEEGAYTLARYTHTNARRFASQDPRWLEEFARQARLYAESFTSRPDRAATLLFAAGRSCEIHAARVKAEVASSLSAEAVSCFRLLKNQYPDMTQGQQATGILRRLGVVGQRLTQFSGPALDGQDASIEQLRGHVTIVLFWSSENAEFQKAYGRLAGVLQQFRSAGVRLLGVSLDREQQQAVDFLRSHPLPGRHIFFPDEDHRRWDNPVVRYWGVLEIPAIWVVAADGTVVSTTASSESLEPLLAQLVRQSK